MKTKSGSFAKMPLCNFSTFPWQFHPTLTRKFFAISKWAIYQFHFWGGQKKSLSNFSLADHQRWLRAFERERSKGQEPSNENLCKVDLIVRHCQSPHFETRSSAAETQARTGARAEAFSRKWDHPWKWAHTYFFYFRALNRHLRKRKGVSN